MMARFMLILSVLTTVLALCGGLRYLWQQILELRARKRLYGRWLLGVMILWVPSVAYGYLTDTGVHTEPTAPVLPSAGSKAVDPTFGTAIIRLTDDADSSVDCNVQYSNKPSFNVNNTYVMAICNLSPKRMKLWNWNATTNTHSNPRISSNRVTSLQEYDASWSYVAYNKYYACANRVLYEVVIPDGSSTTFTYNVIRDFGPEIGGVSTDDCTQISVSRDDDVFAMHYIVGGVNTGYLAYKRSTDTVLLNVNTEGTINEVEIDKSGRWLVVRTAAGNTYVWDLQGTPSRTTVTTEVFNHRAMGNGMAVSACSSNRLCKRSLATPNTVTYILNSGWSYATQQDHFSLVSASDAWMLGCRYHTNAGAVTAAYDNECLQVATDGSGQVRRFVHHRSHSHSNDYDAQTKGASSMDGRYFSWISNWDGADIDTPNHLYIADMYPPVPESVMTFASMTMLVEWGSVVIGLLWHARHLVAVVVFALGNMGLAVGTLAMHTTKRIAYQTALMTVTASVKAMQHATRKEPYGDS